MLSNENIEKIEQMVLDMGKICNGASSRLTQEEIAEVIANQMLLEHNTIEQLMIGVIQKTICKLSETESWRVDARNEASIEWCKKVSQIDAHFPFI